MYVEVSRTGGFAGITRTWAVEVDNTPDPMSWIVLVEACPWDEPEPEPSGADRFIYLVRADEREATLPEPAVAGPWRELVDRVRRFSNNHGRGEESPPPVPDGVPIGAPGTVTQDDGSGPVGGDTGSVPQNDTSVPDGGRTGSATPTGSGPVGEGQAGVDQAGSGSDNHQTPG